MRLLQQEAAEYGERFRNAPVSPSATEAETAAAPLSDKCVPRSGCPWWPYSSARDFKTNTALVVILLFSAFVCALAFNAGIRHILRRRRRRSSGEDSNSDDKAGAGSKKGAEDEDGAAVPTVIYSAAAAEDGGGTVAEECTICLGEFVEGERVRVLENCKHCFHIHCIQRWLNTHSSCPTCRASYP